MICSYKTLVTTYKTIWCHNSEDHINILTMVKNLKSKYDRCQRLQLSSYNITKQIDKESHGSQIMSTADTLSLPVSACYKRHWAIGPSSTQSHSYIWVWNEGLAFPLLTRRTAHVTGGWWLRLLWHRRDVGILGDESSQLVRSFITAQRTLHPNMSCCSYSLKRRV